MTLAKQWAAQVESDIRRGRYSFDSESKKQTVSELIDRYIETVLPTKPRTAKGQLGQLEWWRKQLGHLRLCEVTSPVISKCIDLLGKENIQPELNKQCKRRLTEEERNKERFRAPSTINRYIAVLSHAFTVATKEWYWVEQNPFRDVKKKKEPKGRDRRLTPREQELLLAACKDSESPDLYLAVILALATAGRRGEILSLRWTDYRPVARTARRRWSLSKAPLASF